MSAVIELTDEERAMSFTVAGDDQFHDNVFDEEAVVSIIAARVQALTAERDEYKSLYGGLLEERDAFSPFAIRERDEARAELAELREHISAAAGSKLYAQRDAALARAAGLEAKKQAISDEAVTMASRISKALAVADEWPCHCDGMYECPKHELRALLAADPERSNR